MKFSEEQLAVIHSTKQNIIVNAGPGSGKTTLLLGIVKERKEEKHLILCFNSVIKEEIATKLEKQNIFNADVYTFHGLAFNFFSENDNKYITNFKKRDFSESLDFFTLFHIMKKLRLIFDYEDEKLLKTLCALKTYLNSDKKLEEFNCDENIKKNITSILVYLLKDRKAPMFHEVYIKIFQLLKPITSYHSILIDEYQDVSACYLSIINNISKDKKTVRVGDTYQKIYEYNGAIGMNECDYTLNQSFRISKENSDICNKILSKYFNNYIELNGKNTNQKISYIDNNESYVKIYRTNKQLILELLQFLKEGKKIKVSDKIINMLDTFSYLVNINKFGKYSYKEISVRDLIELKILYMMSKDNILSKFFFLLDNIEKNELREILNNRNNLISEESNESFDIHLITAHRCKGLEFENVLLADDFITLDLIEKKYIEEEFDIVNELYVLFVALTRSNKILELNSDLKEYFNGGVQ